MGSFCYSFKRVHFVPETRNTPENIEFRYTDFTTEPDIHEEEINSRARMVPDNNAQAACESLDLFFLLTHQLISYKLHHKFITACFLKPRNIFFADEICFNLRMRSIYNRSNQNLTGVKALLQITIRISACRAVSRRVGLFIP
ncbi:hypothetical protein RF11_10272 [Thelohanellus kitauei]|uniref:Uncharacterized protein n=1 Tax=Thelohanellus kitauei TaxID=669202 RepID=A0A0C2NDW9_THEKT|nr:hypothetical protein RF11_10272 [Thelohanellus kitauei]